VRRKQELLDRIADLEAQKRAQSVTEKKYKQDLKDLRFQLSRILDKLGTKRDSA